MAAKPTSTQGILLAVNAVAAAHTQYTVVPGEQLAADIVARLAQEVIDLDAALKEIDATIEDRFRRHRYAEIIVSPPGFGPRLGAEFLATLGGDIALYDSADRLAGVAGLAPVPRDSERISSNLHRPRRFNRRLLRASYLAAQLSIRYDPASKQYYDRKRAEGKRHTQAVLALARRRNNVLWAMLRDHTQYQQPSADRVAAA
jgi:transposase